MLVGTRQLVQDCKQNFDRLTDQGQYADQMEKLSEIFNSHAWKALQHIHWHHPREALENIEKFGTTITKLSDICQTCSNNLQEEDGYIPSIQDELFG